MATAPNKRICLVGLHNPSGNFVYDQPKGTEFWGLNEVNRQYPDVRWSRVFQLHPLNWREKERENRLGKLPKGFDRNCFGRNKQYVDWLASVDVPVYMQKKYARIPTSVAYPYEMVKERVGVRPRDPAFQEERFGELRRDHYLPSTAVAMLALALAEGEATEIAVAGIENCGSWREIRFEKGAMEYYMGLAEGKGVKVYRSPYVSKEVMGLLDAPLYAVEPDPEKTWMIGSRRHKMFWQSIETVNGRVRREPMAYTIAPKAGTHVEVVSQARAR